MHPEPGGDLLTSFDAVSLLPSIESPTLVSVGELDAVTPVDASREIVHGLADGIGRLSVLDGAGHFPWLDTPEAYFAELEAFIILKGSIAMDGVSLTVARLEPALVHVMIIPFTWAHTALSSLRAGDRVNLECDMVGKYVARSMELSARGGLSS